MDLLSMRNVVCLLHTLQYVSLFQKHIGHLVSVFTCFFPLGPLIKFDYFWLTSLRLHVFCLYMPHLLLWFTFFFFSHFCFYVPPSPWLPFDSFALISFIPFISFSLYMYHYSDWFYPTTWSQLPLYSVSLFSPYFLTSSFSHSQLHSSLRVLL